MESDLLLSGVVCSVSFGVVDRVMAEQWDGLVCVCVLHARNEQISPREVHYCANGKSPPRTTHRLSFLVFVFGSRFLSVMPTCAQACVQVLGAVPRLLFECFSRTCSRGGQKGRPSRGRAGAGLRQRQKGKEGEGHTVVPPEM